MAKTTKRKLKIEKPSNIKEGNLYDKIFKENAESIFLPLVEERLGIKIVSFQPLTDKLQTTLEREMDFFYEVKTEDGDHFLLHLEFQTDDDAEMIYRNAEYHGIALRQKKLEIKHVVLFLGTQKPQMRTELHSHEIYRGFDMIVLNELNTEELLSSQVPDVVLLAVLSNYNPQHAEVILRSIFTKLKAVCKNEHELLKFTKQLIILSRLRKIDNITTKISQEMPITYDIETDYLYNKGIEKGVEIGIEKERYERNFDFVKKLLLNSDFADDKIALLVGVSIEFVHEVKIKMEIPPQ